MRQLFLLLCCAIISFAGCRKTSDQRNWLQTHPTAGKISINGKSANGAIVRLFPVAPQPETVSPVIPSGVVREDGSFELTSYEIGDGAPEGEYRVTVEWPDPKLLSPQLSMIQDPPDRLKNRFTNPERSTIKVRITAGKNQLEPIVLEKVEILSGSSLQ